jgi:protein TonB
MVRRFADASPNALLLAGEMPAPSTMRTMWWEGTGVSIAVHAIALGILAYAATRVPSMLASTDTVSGTFSFVLPARSGVPTGGGGGGQKTSTPARKADITPVSPRQIEASSNPLDRPAAPEVIVPVAFTEPMQTLPGAVSALDTTSLGNGSGPGAGGGRGPGSGVGDGAGLGDGLNAGFGGDAFQSGTHGVTSPLLIKEVKPRYTIDAMRAKIEGVVTMDAVVLPDGSVDPARIRITGSLDSALGLDREAVLALRQWRFRPGTYKGQPVSVRVNVELAFTLR